MNRPFNLCAGLLVGLWMLPVPGALAQTTLTPDQYEPNDSQSSAANLGSAPHGSRLVIQANFHSSDDTSDWYAVKVEDTSGSENIFTVSLSGTASADLSLSSDKPVDGLPATSSGTTTTLVANGWGTATTDDTRTFYVNVRRSAGVVDNNNYSLTLFAGRLLEPPVITSLTPSQGPVGAKVSILGANLNGTSSIKFNGVTAAITERSSTSITTNVPIGATTGPIMVVSPGGSTVAATAFTVTGEATSPSKKGGISPVSPDKKQPPSVKSGTPQAPSSKVPDAKAAKKRTGPKPNCIGMGCDDDAPTCVGMGCGKTEPTCVGMGCEKKDAAIPNKSGPTGAAKLPSVQKPTVHGLEPCCNITSIAAGGLVTAQEHATGKIFQFQAKDQALMKSLRVGQNVYADFGTQQVSVDGATPCCGIVSGTSAPTGAARIQ